MFGLHYLKHVTTLTFDQEKCSGCGMCTIVCPHAVFQMNGKKALCIDKDACMECGACAKNCPSKAITVRAGVGCAAGIIMGTLKGTGPTCDTTETSGSCCG